MSQSPTAPTTSQRLLGLGAPVLGVALFVALWWVGTNLLAPPNSFLNRFSPDKALAELIALLSTGQLWPHLLSSARRIFIGIAVSAAIGIPLGLALGSVAAFSRMFSPIFQFIRMVSPLSWTPLAIIVLGVGDMPVYFLIAIAGIWPIALNTAAGVAALDPRWLLVGRSLRGTPLEIAWTIVWPGIRAHVLTGLRLTVGLAWIVLVPAEMLGVDSGLGYFILDTRDRLAYSQLMAVIIVVGLCGFGLDSLTRFLLAERRSRGRAPAEQREIRAEPAVASE